MKKYIYILIALCFAFVGCRKQPVLDVDKASISATSASCTETITVTANYPWSATSSCSWVRVSYTEGESTLKLSISANNDTEGRQGTITLTSEELSKTITVTQAQRDAIELNVSGRITLDATAQQFEVKLRSNVDLVANVTEGADWLSVVSTKAMTDHVVTLAVKANDDHSMRRALVSFSDPSGSVNQQIMVDQDGKPQVLAVGFQGVKRFDVPTLDAMAGVVLSGLVFWDQSAEGIPYSPGLFNMYDGGAGSLRIEANNATSVHFANVSGIVSIDLSEF